MRIGDKVRLLRGTEEGYIVNISGNIVDVEIEDGFTIPCVKNEVVVIDRKEAESFETAKEDEVADIRKPQSAIKEGVYIAIGDQHESRYNSYLVNQTPNTILASLNTLEKKIYFGHQAVMCDAYSVFELKRLKIAQSVDRLKLNVQVLIHEEKSAYREQPMEIDMMISKGKFKDKVTVHSIDEPVALFLIEEEAVQIDIHQLKMSMTEKQSQPAKKTKAEKRQKKHEIDLHTDPSMVGISDKEVLSYQLRQFETAYDQALLANAESLKIIHGIGAGVLRNEIHKKLSKKEEVRFFEDADKEKFGYGSTIAYF